MLGVSWKEEKRYNTNGGLTQPVIRQTPIWLPVAALAATSVSDCSLVCIKSKFVQFSYIHTAISRVYKAPSLLFKHALNLYISQF